MNKCFYCPKDNDLRPYGPRGAMVCFRCATETPERKKDTELNYAHQLLACGDSAVIGTEAGPFPPRYLKGAKHD